MFLIKSKSTIQSKIKYSMLRYTLTGLERDYQIRIPSNGLYKKERRFCSTLDSIQNASKINPWFLTGFIDGEGCFRISILNNRNFKQDSDNVPFKTRLYFQLSLHKKDEKLLELLKDNFKVVAGAQNL